MHLIWFVIDNKVYPSAQMYSESDIKDFVLNGFPFGTFYLSKEEAQTVADENIARILYLARWRESERKRKESIARL